jgi:hypothetical protein
MTSGGDARISVGSAAWPRTRVNGIYLYPSPSHPLTSLGPGVSSHNVERGQGGDRL